MAALALGGVTCLAGIGLTALGTFWTLAGDLGPRGEVVALGYGAALALVGLGALLATLFVADWPPVTSGRAYLCSR